MAEEDWGRCQRRTLIGVRLTPKSGHQSDVAPCPLCAKSGLMHRSKKDRYSITSSARPSSESGMVRPSALAVFMLMISSTLVACWTGRSATFSPLSDLASRMDDTDGE
jgi:hypothetical protein